MTSDMIAQSKKLIRAFIRRTPVVQVDGAEFGLPGHLLTLKLEQLQHPGSFKARGAFANLLPRDVPKAGVVAASGGNHGAAVAYAAMELACRPDLRADRLFARQDPAHPRLRRRPAVKGDRYAEALAASESGPANRRTAGAGLDQEETIMGQGTLALELAGRRRISTHCWCRWAAAG